MLITWEQFNEEVNNLFQAFLLTSWLTSGIGAFLMFLNAGAGFMVGEVPAACLAATLGLLWAVVNFAARKFIEATNPGQVFRTNFEKYVALNSH